MEKNILDSNTFNTVTVVPTLKSLSKMLSCSFQYGSGQTCPPAFLTCITCNSLDAWTRLAGCYKVNIWWLWWLKHELWYTVFNFLAFQPLCDGWMWHIRGRGGEIVSLKPGEGWHWTCVWGCVGYCCGKVFLLKMWMWGAEVASLPLVCMEFSLACKLWPGCVRSQLNHGNQIINWNTGVSFIITLVLNLNWF